MVDESSLNQALAAAVPTPIHPPELRSQVLAAIARDAVPRLEQRQRALAAQHRADIAALNARYLNRGRNALLTGLAFMLSIGHVIGPLAQQLAPLLGHASITLMGYAPTLVGLAVLGLGMLIGATILSDFLERS